MTINDLIIILQEQADEFGDDTEVVIVHQESYPLRESVHGVAPPYDSQEIYDEVLAANPGISIEAALEIVAEDAGPLEVTIVAGGHPNEGSPYGSRTVWENAAR